MKEANSTMSPFRNPRINPKIKKAARTMSINPIISLKLSGKDNRKEYRM